MKDEEIDGAESSNHLRSRLFALCALTLLELLQSRGRTVARRLDLYRPTCSVWIWKFCRGVYYFRRYDVQRAGEGNLGTFEHLRRESFPAARPIASAIGFCPLSHHFFYHHSTATCDRQNKHQEEEASVLVLHNNTTPSSYHSGSLSQIYTSREERKIETIASAPGDPFTLLGFPRLPPKPFHPQKQCFSRLLIRRGEGQREMSPRPS